MKAGRYVIESHCHAQRVAAGPEVKERVAQARRDGVRLNPWRVLGNTMPGLTPYRNTERLFYDMAAYEVDMCVLLPAFGMNDEINAGLVAEYPDKFIAECGAMDYAKRCRAGEIEYSIDGACAELDRLLSTGSYRGIGEMAPYMPILPPGADPRLGITGEAEALGNMFRVAEVARKHDVVCRTHSGCTMGYEGGPLTGQLGPLNFNIFLVHDLATAFPAVNFVINHGGIQGNWNENFYSQCLQVAAAHDNVYLETGLWWRELYEAALRDPNLGPEKLIFGTDWGASIECVSNLGRYPDSYFTQVRAKGPISHQSDYWGWALRELLAVRCSQDDRNLILGGNTARLYGIELPLSRLMRPRELDG